MTSNYSSPLAVSDYANIALVDPTGLYDSENPPNEPLPMYDVDFYSGILYRAMGVPTDMFTVMFALGRIPGWIAHWREVRSNPNQRICRPRQIYTGPTLRSLSD